MDINIDISKVLVLYFTIINKRILKYNDIKIIKKTDKAMEQCFGIKKNEENIWIYFNNIIVWNIIKAIGYQSNNINYGLYAFNKENKDSSLESTAIFKSVPSIVCSIISIF